MIDIIPKIWKSVVNIIDKKMSTKQEQILKINARAVPRPSNFKSRFLGTSFPRPTSISKWVGKPDCSRHVFGTTQGQLERQRREARHWEHPKMYQLEKYPENTIPPARPCLPQAGFGLSKKYIFFQSTLNTIHSVFLGRKINVCLSAKLKTRQSPNNQYKFGFLWIRIIY